MRHSARLAENRIAVAIFQFVLPTASLVMLGAIFWIGFSGGGETTRESSRDTGGAENVTYSAILADGSDLEIRADSAVMLKDDIHASKIRGTLVKPDGHIRTLTASSAATPWSLDSAEFQDGTLLETADDGTEVEFSLQSGSADFARLEGHPVNAHLRIKGDDSIQSLVAGHLNFELATGFGELTGGATFRWNGGKSDDWFEVHSEGFRVWARQAAVESTGTADFTFYGGNGQAGQMRITASDEGDIGAPGGTVSLVNGVEITFLAPFGTSE